MDTTGYIQPKQMPPPCFRLSNELWLRVFGYLDRNDVDNCEQVCIKWHHLVRCNHRYLPARVIDYIILSSKRYFSVTVCSGSIIKVYKFHKYFNKLSIERNLNDPSYIKVETIRRCRANRALFKFSNVEQLYLNCTSHDTDPMDTTDGTTEDMDQSASSSNNSSISLSFKLPPKALQTRHKIKTPPVLFFQKLNLLFKNLKYIRHFVFQRFTLTDGFVEKWLMHVHPIITAGDVCLYKTKRDFIRSACNSYLFGILLKEKAVPSDEPEEVDLEEDLQANLIVLQQP